MSERTEPEHEWVFTIEMHEQIAEELCDILAKTRGISPHMQVVYSYLARKLNRPSFHVDTYKDHREKCSRQHCKDCAEAELIEKMEGI